MQSGGDAGVAAQDRPSCELTATTARAALRAAGLASDISNSAGSFVCNHVFYALMHLAAAQGNRWRGGFLHVPYAFDPVARPQARMRIDDIVRAIVISLDAASGTSKRAGH